jgi:uncharacterized SAM-binding protein YcdF (DUF218 family)
MQCFKRCALVIAGLIVMSGIVVIIWVTSIVGLLNSPDQPRKVDAIVVLASELSRVLEAVDLYKAGFATRILLSTPGREKRLEHLERAGVSIPWFEIAGRELLERQGVPKEAISVFGHNLRSTVHEAETVGTQHPSIKSILLVTSPYHVSRSRRIFRDTLKDVEVLGISSRYEALPDVWWKDAESARHVLMESAKYIFYLAGGRM